MRYRKEIDGLRAVAVIPVILFHAGYAGFSGGYIGVDIFFVISGYLITSIILLDLKSDRFSVINFYERRARRIIPALSVVLLFASIAAVVIFPPDRMKSFSESLVSVITFSSNIYFYLTSGYFSVAANEKPLLHIWSLSVEEQFYLFFPLILAFFWRRGKKKAQTAMIFIAVVSLGIAQYLAIKNAVNANFYLIFSRAWELMVGSLIALYALHERPMKSWHRELLGWTGLVMILVSIYWFTDQTPFPSFYTLLPVLGTALIITTANAHTSIGKVLSLRVLVFIGLISYSLYLWHHVLFAFIRFRSINDPSPLLLGAAILVSVLLAYLSWKYIETPFRNRQLLARKTVFRFTALTIALFLSLGLSGYVFQGFQGRFPEQEFASTIKFSPKRKACHTSGENYLHPQDACRYFSDHVTWAGFGDSTVVELDYALAEELENQDQGLIHLSFSSCPPSLLFELRTPGCTDWIRESLDYLVNDDQITHVLLGFRYSNFLFGSQLGTYPDLPDTIKRSAFTNAYQSYTDQELRELYWESLEEMVNRLLQAGKKVYILYPLPELPGPIEKISLPVSIFSDRTLVDLEKTTTLDYYYHRNEFIISKLDTLSYDENLIAIKPAEILCGSEYCPAVLDGKALYFDDHHLSITGAELVARDIMEKSE